MIGALSAWGARHEKKSRAYLPSTPTSPILCDKALREGTWPKSACGSSAGKGPLLVGLVADESFDVSRNLAVEEALVRAASQAPVVRVWRNPACVVLGRFQCPEREVDLSACARDGVAVLRRASGGGTVYQDFGNLNVSLVLPGATGALPALADALVWGLQRFGLCVRRAARGLFVEEHKLSGFAEQRTAVGSLAHASVLVSTPGWVVDTYLAAGPAVGHPLDSARCQVASLRDHGFMVDVEDVKVAVVAALTWRLGCLVRRELTETERGWVKRLLASRYGDPVWHLGADVGKRQEAWIVRHGSSFTAP